MIHNTKRHAWLFAAVLLAGCGSASEEQVGTSRAALEGESGISADVVLDSQWGQGYCARVVVRNEHATATTGTWSVGLNIGPGTTFSTWDGVFSGNTGTITVTPLAANAAIPPGASRQFGLCASIPTSGIQPAVLGVTSDLPPPASGAVVSEYKLPAALDELVTPDRPTELWAALYRPQALEEGRQYPLVVFLHGSHATCGRLTSDRRIDDDSTYTTTGTCPSTHPIVVPNHRGYDYIALELAARGYLVVSINANRGIGGLTENGRPDPFLIGTRGRLVLRHLQQLSQWDAGEATPPELGVNLEDRIDFSQVGLFGHSRGGNGVRAAYSEYRRSGSAWPALIEEPVTFRGIFEIGPTDEAVDGELLTAIDVPWNVLLPACDWDQSTLPGLNVFERALYAPESTPAIKSFYHVWGANHNFYNSEWMQEDSTGPPGNVSGCFNHDRLFEPGASGSAAQRETGRFAALAFFTANVGVERDETQNALFDPAFPLAVPYRVSRGYHPGGSPILSLRLEDFVNPTGTSSYGLLNETGGSITVSHGRWAALSNIIASPSTFFQTNFAPVDDGFDLTGYDFLDIRAARLGGNEYSTEVVTFDVELVNEDDSRSSPVSISSYLELGLLPRGNSTLPTARIPLTAFAGADLSAVRAVRLTFPSPIPEGFGVHVANIRATRLTTPTP